MQLPGLLILPFSFFFCAANGASRVQTPYDFYFDELAKINSALYWIRSLVIPLGEDSYNHAPEFIDIVVVIHGTELVTVAKKITRNIRMRSKG